MGPLGLPYNQKKKSENFTYGVLGIKIAPSKLKNVRVGYADIEESFDTMFNMGYGGGGGIDQLNIDTSP